MTLLVLACLNHLEAELEKENVIKIANWSTIREGNHGP